MRLLLAAFSFTCLAGWVPCLSAQNTPVSGLPQPSLSALDTVMQQLMVKWQVPGAALALTKDGRLVLAHGYGYADQAANQPVQPDSLFRIASVSKPFTAAAILKLIEQGKLNLTTHAFSVLSDLTPPPGTTPDARLANITIQNLLEHKGGWDRSIAGDPPFTLPIIAAQAFGATPPATPDLLIRYMMGQPLQFTPGTTSVYSNFGYIVLGAIIERASGQSYENYVRSAILAPLGIQRMRLGKSLVADRAVDEVKYYDYPGAPLSSSVFPTGPVSVPTPYGGFALELLAGAGGWIASTMDFCRYADNINGQLPPNVLQSPPAGFVSYVPPVGDGWGWIFDGSLPGTNSIVHLDTGFQVSGRVTWAVLFNTRPGGNPSPDLLGDADDQILKAVQGITSWPSGDLFPTYSGSTSACSFSLSSSTGNAAAGGGTGSVALTVSNNCAWQADSNAAWLRLTSAASGNDSASLQFSVDANTSSSSRTGMLTVAGRTFTVTQAAAQIAGKNTPTADSASPAFGNTANQSFVFQFSDADGWQDLGVLNVLINNALDGRHACYVGYSRPDNVLFLVNDTGDGLLPGLALNGSGAVGNSQCTVTGAGSFASGSGNTLTLTLNVSFNAAFGGNKLLYLAARDSIDNNSGWQTLGVHGVPPVSSTFPVSVSMNPPAGTSSSSVLTYTYQDQSNASNLQTTWALINSALDGGGACYAAYYRPGNQLFLLPDNGDGSQATSMVLNGTSSLSNSQCTILGSGSSASVSGNQLMVTLNTVFKPAFAGRKGVWLGAVTSTGQSSNWQALGTWRVPGT